jgi:TolA-binding protein
MLLLWCSSCFMTPEKKSYYYQPLNKMQTEFYNIQTLYEAQKNKETVQVGEDFIKKYPRDVLAVSVQYYVGVAYQRLGMYDKAEELFTTILKSNPEDEWKKLATVALQEVKDVQGRTISEQK